MIKNWLSFNESYDQSLINFTREEAEAFLSYYKKEVWGKLCGDNLSKKDSFVKLLDKFIDIVNGEFDSNVDFSESDISFSIIEPLDGKNGSQDISSTHPGVYPDVDKLSKTWELLKYKDFKPGYVVKLKLPIDEELKNSRWALYYKKVLNDLNEIPNTKIGVFMSGPTTTHSRYEIGYIPFYIYIRYEDFKFVDPFSKENVIDFILSYPNHLNAMFKWADKEEIFDLLSDNPELRKNLKGQNLLDFTKRIKSIENPQRRQMEEENQMYVFIARPSFKEKEDGSYSKDIEIENLVPIDPYDSKDAYALSMMKMRARMQGGNSEVYCIWLPKEFEKSELRDINDDSMTYLRKLVDQKKERI